MARQIWTDKELLDSLAIIQPSEEDKYSDIPGWKDEEYISSSPKAVLLRIHSKGDIWFPLSHLRIAEDKQSIYASEWILKEKGL